MNAVSLRERDTTQRQHRALLPIASSCRTTAWALKCFRSLQTDGNSHATVESHRVRMKLSRRSSASKVPSAAVARVLSRQGSFLVSTRDGIFWRLFPAPAPRCPADASSTSAWVSSDGFPFRLRAVPVPEPQHHELSRLREELAGGRTVSCHEPLHSHPLQAGKRVGKCLRLSDVGDRKNAVGCIAVLPVL